LIDIADRVVSFDAGTKGRGYYAVYDRYFGDLARPSATVLELGVYQGQSTKVLASYFKDGKIIAIDSDERKIDFSAFPNVVFERADQRNAKELTAICERHALDGIDIVIDDAAHIGSWSRASYETLLPRLNPGGLYIVEDWGTGYWGDWPEGRALRRTGRMFGRLTGRIPSHDYGMVGFLKSLIEDVSVDIKPRRDAPDSRAPQLEFMHVYGGLAVLKKFGRQKIQTETLSPRAFA
jgi:SAM-dependent methyltransferase